jgi:hypothetical protein
MPIEGNNDARTGVENWKPILYRELWQSDAEGLGRPNDSFSRSTTWRYQLAPHHVPPVRARVAAANERCADLSELQDRALGSSSKNRFGPTVDCRRDVRCPGHHDRAVLPTIIDSNSADRGMLLARYSVLMRPGLPNDGSLPRHVRRRVHRRNRGDKLLYTSGVLATRYSWTGVLTGHGPSPSWPR